MLDITTCQCFMKLQDMKSQTILSSSPNAHVYHIGRRSSGIKHCKDYNPHPCGLPFGLGIAYLNLFQTNLSRPKIINMGIRE